jgi:hypothetical protein
LQRLRDGFSPRNPILQILKEEELWDYTYEN